MIQKSNSAHGHKTVTPSHCLNYEDQGSGSCDVAGGAKRNNQGGKSCKEFGVKPEGDQL